MSTTIDNHTTYKIPGKLILSGEHAVVYGNPALAVAINKHVCVRLDPQDDNNVTFVFGTTYPPHSVSLNTLPQLKTRLEHKHQQFLAGRCSIDKVLDTPYDLCSYSAALALGHCKQLSGGMRLTINSTLPIGCGMGSSAALILAILKTICRYNEQSLSNKQAFELALQAEHLQHGTSSGLDIQVALTEGALLWQKGQPPQARKQPALALHYTNTGQPQSSTGECVASARAHLKNSQLLEAFKTVTCAMDAAIANADIQAMQHTIRENHRLLVTLGVVPASIRTLIDTIEGIGGAAKICGAGAIRGDKAGALLIATADKIQLNKVQALCNEQGFCLNPLSDKTVNN